LGALYQFWVRRDSAPWFVNTGGGDHFDCENVSGLELSIRPLKVLADAMNRPVAVKAKAEIAISPGSPLLACL
jgi:hypothetical protein